MSEYTRPAIRGVRTCPYDDCDWEWTHDLDWDGHHMADHEAEMHIEREHWGRVRVRVVLEREELLFPGGEAIEAADRHHERVAERLAERDGIYGYEVAYTVAEAIDQPDEPLDENRVGNSEVTPGP